MHYKTYIPLTSMRGHETALQSSKLVLLQENVLHTLGFFESASMDISISIGASSDSSFPIIFFFFHAPTPPPNPIISNLPHCSLTQCLPNSTLFFPMSNVQCPMTIPPLQDAARICSVGFASPLTSLVSNFKPHICFCTPSVVIRYNRT
jgi:hypothetical protein